MAGTIRRYDSDTPLGRISPPPEKLKAADLLIGNPGIQGSNLSVRLSTLLQAGTFDEALRSCTDRDLCIRLTDLGAHYRPAPGAVAHHDCRHGQARLSDPGGVAKWQGLDAFHAKWELRMTAAQLEASVRRAHRLFGWRPAQPTSHQETPPSDPINVSVSAEPLSLVAGVIVDGNKPGRCLPLIDGLARLAAHPRVSSVDIVLLENGRAEGFATVVEHARSLRLVTWAVELAAQRMALQALPLAVHDISSAKSIAVARTLLQRFVYEVCQERNCPPAWILDDDYRLPNELDDLVARLILCRDDEVDVILGGNVGSAPVPASAVQRTQLVDLAHFLSWVGGGRPDEPYPDAVSRNRPWLCNRQDIHYDLSRSETDRLETPLLPVLDARHLDSAVFQLMDQAERILAGEAITRQVARIPNHRLEEAPQSCHRGGNTFVMKLELLRDIPNLAPRLDKRPIRRSDMIWAANARYRCGADIRAFSLPMQHDRSIECAEQDDTQRLVDDILGYGFFTAYETVLAGRKTTGPFSKSEREQVLHLTQKHSKERLAAYRLSVWRIQGVLRWLRRLIASDPWWWRNAPAATRIAFNRFLSLLKKQSGPERLSATETQVTLGIETAEFEGFIAEMDLLNASSKRVKYDHLKAWVLDIRETRARAQVAARLQRGDMEFIGIGAEGVVLRAGQRVVKVFDRWTPAERREAAPMLTALLMNPVSTALPVLLATHEWPEAFAVEYQFEESRPYLGGYGPALIALLQDLDRGGWVHTNLAPKNLRLTEKGLQIIDIGKSLEPATPLGQERMVRRAFLSWRFSNRTDLTALLRGAIDNEHLPELTGWRVLLEAVRQDPAKTRLDDWICGRVAASQSRTVLDYGCGKPRYFRRMSARMQLTVFDVDPTLRERWRNSVPWVPFWTERNLVTALAAGERFDLVLCSLVLCTLSDTDMIAVTEKLRQLVSDAGHVIVAVCDPTAIHVGEALDQTRFGVEDWDPSLPTWYRKRVRGSGNLRDEFHRPVEAYRRAFAKAGLRVDTELSIHGFDAERLERVPEFLVFELSPLPLISARTTLLIKLCAMEAGTARQQVCHMERQLARPRAFDEIVLLIDPHEGPFPRAHSPPDLAGLRCVAAQLQAEGIVDRIVEGFVDGAAAAAASRQWTYGEAPAAHCANGQPATAILDALSSAKGDFILHADADVLIARPIPAGDHIAEAIEILNRHPDAVTLAPSVCGDTDTSPRRGHTDGTPYRVEAIFGWVHKRRLMALRPLAGGAKSGKLRLPWHRMVDLLVQQGKAASLRCGSETMWFTSVDNLRKGSRDSVDLIMGRMEAQVAPTFQVGRALAAGALTHWLGPKRDEPLVVVVCGRNVRPGAVDRCFSSLTNQSNQEWGAIIVDDASDEPCREAVRRACNRLQRRVTLLHRHRRMGMLANVFLAVRDFVEAPESAIVLLDLDDALADPDALAIVAAKHRDGADVTVGSMLRTDKATVYPVEFVDPRAKRGGNVWQHLRSFRKSLFDRIAPSDLKLQGDWIDLANDWAYMLPIVEMANNPVWLREKLYFHEPSTTRPPQERAARERVVSQIVSKPTYRRRATPKPKVTVLCYRRILNQAPVTGPDVFFHRTGMAVTTATLRSQLTHVLETHEPVTIKDLLAAQRGDRSLPENALLVTVDHGFRDFAEYGYEVMLHAGVEPVLFVRRPAADGIPTWGPLDLLYVGSGIGGADTLLPDADQRARLLDLPLHRQIDEVERMIGGGRAELDQARRDLYLSEAELRTLPGIALGCHGIEHVRWTNLDDNCLRSMLRVCRAWLAEMKTNALVTAYPDGAVDSRVASHLYLNGFEAGFAIDLPANAHRPFYAWTRTVMTDDPNQPVPVPRNEYGL